MEPHYLYLIIRKDGAEYVGVTKNVKRRKYLHKKGYGSTHLKDTEFTMKILVKGEENYIYNLENLYVDKFKPCLNKVKGGKCGGSVFGSTNGRALIKEQDALDIRILYSETNITQKDLAEKYNVSRQTIGAITTGVSWKTVGGPLTKKLNRVSIEDRNTIYNLYTAGTSIQDISDNLNIKWNTVYMHIKGEYI